MVSGGPPPLLSPPRAHTSQSVLARTSKDLETLTSVIKTRYSVPALAITGSILDSGAKIIAEVESELGPMDVLVNNAGIQRMSRFASETDLSGWWKTVELNLLGPISMIHAVLPGFKVRGHGTIITVGSAVADITVPFMSS